MKRTFEPNTSNSVRKRKLPYSISAGPEWQPCEKPWESVSDKGGVALGFNFWIENNQVLDGDLTNLITSVILGLDHPNFIKSGSSNPKSIVIAAIHGLDPMTLAEHLTNAPFLSECSAIPIRHSALYGNKWYSNETDSMTSLLLWPLKPSLTYKEIIKFPIDDLFRQSSVIFKATHYNWNDYLIFNYDNTVRSQFEQKKPTDGSLDSIIQ
eukprot:gene13404-28427_t